MCDPHLRLRRLLAASADPRAALVEEARAPWQSAVYAGEHHRFVFVVPAHGAHPLDGMDTDDLMVPGHLVTEIGCTTRAGDGGDTYVEVAATTLEAA